MKFETNIWIDAVDVKRFTIPSNLSLRKWFDEKYGREARIQAFAWAAFLEVGAKEAIDFIRTYATLSIYDEGENMREITAESINKIAGMISAGGDFFTNPVVAFEVQLQMLNFVADNQNVSLKANATTASLQGRNSSMELYGSEDNIIVLSGTGQHLKSHEDASHNLIICTGNANTIECSNSYVILTGVGNTVTGKDNIVISYGERDTFNMDGERSEVFSNSDHSKINFNGGSTFFYAAQPTTLARDGILFKLPVHDEDGNPIYTHNEYRYEYDSDELYLVG